MKPILRATAILGSSSVVSILAGLASAKVWAMLLGPAGYGLMGLLQSLVGLASLVAGMGIEAGLVRTGAKALARGDHRQVAALRWAAWFLLGGSGSLALLLLVVYRMPISQWMLGGPEHTGNVVLMGAALLFGLAAGIQGGTLNAYHRVAALAGLGIASSVLSALVGIGIVWVWREQGIAPAIIGGAAISWTVAHFTLRREVGQPPTRPTRQEVREAARSLLRFGGPYTASMIVGTGVELALPILVLHTLGTESVGFYRAAVAVSGNYLGFLLSVMALDYYPRVSVAIDQPVTLVHLINQQHRLIMLLGAPVILCTMALCPYFVPVIYSPQFHPTVDLLEWQLLGDLLKYPGWIMCYVVLARSGRLFFYSELISGMTTLITSWLGMAWFGLPGLGIAFVITHAVYYVAVGTILRREIGHAWSTENKLMLRDALLAALVVQLLSLVSLTGIRALIALAFAVVLAVKNWYAIRREAMIERNRELNLY